LIGVKGKPEGEGSELEGKKKWIRGRRGDTETVAAEGGNLLPFLLTKGEKRKGRVIAFNLDRK